MDYNTCLFSYQRIMLKNLYLFFILHQTHCFLFQFDSSLFFIMQILINVWYVCVNKQWTVNIHLIFYRLLQQTILTSCSQFKATMDWLSLCQWLFKRKYHLLFSCTYFVLSQNPYTKQLFLDSVHSPYIEQKQQAVSHTFQHLFKKNQLPSVGLTGCVLILLISYRQFDLRFLSIIFQLFP